MTESVPITYSRWLHFVLNFIGPNDGEGIRIYLDGEMVQSVTAAGGFRIPPRHSRIIIGRSTIDSYFGRYASLQMDELLFFNQALSEEEIAMLSQTNR